MIIKRKLKRKKKEEVESRRVQTGLVLSNMIKK